MMRNILAFVLLFFTGLAWTQETHSEMINREFEKPEILRIANISGDIHIEGHAGSQVIVEVEKYLKAKTQARIQEGLDEISLGSSEDGDMLLLYMNEPCQRFRKYYDEDDNEERWGYQWEKGCRWEPLYKYRLNYTVKVPQGVNLILSTVNHGDVVVSNFEGDVKAKNVNGAIELTNIAGATRARTINGDVDISYTTNPTEACSYYTLNGDINAYFARGLSAEMTFESFNGDFFTSMDYQPLPMKVTTETSNKKGTRYKIGGKSSIQVGGGGVMIEFETFNGDVYVKERS